MDDDDIEVVAFICGAAGSKRRHEGETERQKVKKVKSGDEGNTARISTTKRNEGDDNDIKEGQHVKEMTNVTEQRSEIQQEKRTVVARKKNQPTKRGRSKVGKQTKGPTHIYFSSSDEDVKKTGVGSACTVKPTHIRFVSSSEEGSPKKGPTHIRFVSSSEEESPNGPNGDETRNRDDENDDDQTVLSCTQFGGGRNRDDETDDQNGDEADGGRYRHDENDNQIKSDEQMNKPEKNSVEVVTLFSDSSKSDPELFALKEDIRELISDLKSDKDTMKYSDDTSDCVISLSGLTEKNREDDAFDDFLDDLDDEYRKKGKMMPMGCGPDTFTAEKVKYAIMFKKQELDANTSEIFSLISESDIRKLEHFEFRPHKISDKILIGKRLSFIMQKCAMAERRGTGGYYRE